MMSTNFEFDRAKFHADLEKVHAEITKLAAETAKINSENKFYPFIVGATVTLAIVAIVKLFL